MIRPLQLRIYSYYLQLQQFHTIPILLLLLTYGFIKEFKGTRESSAGFVGHFNILQLFTTNITRLYMKYSQQFSQAVLHEVQKSHEEISQTKEQAIVELTEASTKVMSELTDANNEYIRGALDSIIITSHKLEQRVLEERSILRAEVTKVQRIVNAALRAEVTKVQRIVNTTREAMTNLLEMQGRVIIYERNKLREELSKQGWEIRSLAELFKQQNEDQKTELEMHFHRYLSEEHRKWKEAQQEYIKNRIEELKNDLAVVQVHPEKAIER